MTVFSFYYYYFPGRKRSRRNEINGRNDSYTDNWRTNRYIWRQRLRIPKAIRTRCIYVTFNMKRIVGAFVLTECEEKRPHEREMVARDQCQRDFPRPAGQSQQGKPVESHFPAAGSRRSSSSGCLAVVNRAVVVTGCAREKSTRVFEKRRPVGDRCDGRPGTRRAYRRSVQAFGRVTRNTLSVRCPFRLVNNSVFSPDGNDKTYDDAVYAVSAAVCVRAPCKRTLCVEMAAAHRRRDQRRTVHWTPSSACRSEKRRRVVVVSSRPRARWAREPKTSAPRGNPTVPSDIQSARYPPPYY